ncbi:MAG: type II secretion system protein M [Rhodoferax sp.]|nr:type II secretion system protein M [Rhodoferax sp.]
MTTANTLASLRQAWSRLAQRERRLVALALAVVLAGLLWSLAVAPALGVLRTAPVRLAELDRQLQSMQDLAAQARALQGRAPVPRDDAVRTLESALQQRMPGRAQLSRAGDRVTVTLSGVQPRMLAQWLGQVRDASRVSVQQARLTRSPAGWDGSVVLQLPPE